MKLKVINNISAACFFLSSASLLSIPFLNIYEGTATPAILFALLFWSGLLIGSTLQIVLWVKTRKCTKTTDKKMAKKITAISFFVAVVFASFILHYYETNSYALPITLFVALFSAEMFCTVKRRERLS